ncbi:MAG: class I SAM-dependent methyltransferase [Bdellovibrionales bacterium]|nr:class I SAM-dependent methyltransferase [Bdellovibrionales bacterium]
MNALSESVNLIENVPRTANIFFNILSNIEFGSLTLETPMGQTYYFKGNQKGQAAHLKILNWQSIDRILLNGDIGLGESYINEWWESNDISKLIQLAIDNSKSFSRLNNGSLIRLIFFKAKHWLNRNTKKGSRKNIHAHYDLGNNFYSKWLDKTMTYSSAMFSNKLEPLEQAQKNKYQYILETLNVKPGDHILEIGCGWGGFMDYASSLGCQVTGITISEEQYHYAKARLKNRANLINVLLKDYRDVTGRYDHIVSIEMFEAIGEEYWSTYFAKIKSLLNPRGKVLIQSIHIRNEDFASYKKGSDFIQQYIFPGGMLPSPRLFNAYAVKAHFKVHGQKEFGLDYARTLNIWEKKFFEEKKCILEMGYSERFIRTWTFYLKYCEGGFNSKKIGVSQFLLSHGNEL